MTGWTWASVDDVNALFNHYIGSDVLGPGPDGVELEYSVAGAFFNDGWRGNSDPIDKIQGLTRSREESPGSIWRADWWQDTELGENTSYAHTNGSDGVDDGNEKSETVGGWFYRTP